MIQLQERDLKVLRVVSEQGFTTSDQINHYFFSGVSRKNVHKRIKELETEGMLKTEFSSYFGGRKIICLGSAGQKLLKAKLPLTQVNQTRPAAATIIHDHFVTSLRLRLEQIWDGTWIPERYLKTLGFPQIPDGVFRFPSGIEIALELENSDKGRKRFHALQSRWEKTKVILVLYVVTHPKLYERILDYIKSGPKVPHFGIVLWSELECGLPKIHAQSEDLDIFQRRALP